MQVYALKKNNVIKNISLKSVDKTNKYTDRWGHSFEL